MESREDTSVVFSDPRNDRQVDWSRYGLGDTENNRTQQSQSRSYDEFGPEMYQTGTNELFAQEYVSNLCKI